MVPGAGLEPARSFLRGILSPLCLPIPPPGQIIDSFLFILIIVISRINNLHAKKKLVPDFIKSLKEIIMLNKVP